MSKLDGKLLIHSADELEKLFEPEERKFRFFHQTTSLDSIRKNGWDLRFRSGQRRLYGDGIYFSMPKPFWPDKRATITAHLKLTACKFYETSEDVGLELQKQGINNQGDAAQTQVERKTVSGVAEEEERLSLGMARVQLIAADVAG